MIVIKGIEYRSLEEQVYKNMIDIAEQALALTALDGRVTALEKGGGEPPANMMTTDTEQNVTGAKTFVDNVNGDTCEIEASGISIIQDFAEGHSSTVLNSAGTLDMTYEVKEAGETTERYQTVIAADYVYFSTSSSDSPSPDEESYLMFPVGRDRETLATQNDIKKYYRHRIFMYSSEVAGPPAIVIIGYLISSRATPYTKQELTGMTPDNFVAFVNKLYGIQGKLVVNSGNGTYVYTELSPSGHFVNMFYIDQKVNLTTGWLVQDNVALELDDSWSLESYTPEEI